MTEIILGNYVMSEFKVLSNDRGRVSFKVNSTIRMINREDVDKVKTLIFENLGKWENLVKSSFQLFYEIGIIDRSKNLAPIYNEPSGIQRYTDLWAEWDAMNRCIWVSISLTPEEYEKRRTNCVAPLIDISEIESQLKNIPKWIDLQRTLKSIKETCLL
jgi:hypothetical protein